MLIILAAAGLVVTLVARWRRLRPAAHVLLPVLLAAALPARRHPGLAATAGILLPSSRRPGIGCPEPSRPMRTASTQLGCGMAPEAAEQVPAGINGVEL